MATVRARLEALEKAARRHKRCRCWDVCPIIVDDGDGKAEYPPGLGDVCPKCGMRFRGIPGASSILVIKTGGKDGAH